MAAPSMNPPRNGRGGGEMDFEALKRLIHGKLVEKLDLSRLGDLEGDTLRREIRLVVEHLCDTENPLLNRAERERLIEEVLDETFGFGPLEILLKEQGVADIMITARRTFSWKKGVASTGTRSRSAIISTCCRFSTGSSRASVAVATKPIRWSMPGFQMARV